MAVSVRMMSLMTCSGGMSWTRAWSPLPLAPLPLAPLPLAPLPLAPLTPARP
jgi:hypothetical protein